MDTNLVEAQRLVKQLEEKIAKYFPEPPRDDRHAEMQLLRAQIEKLGFTTSFNASYDFATGVCTAHVTLAPCQKIPAFH
jgi:hypothetical protein